MDIKYTIHRLTECRCDSSLKVTRLSFELSALDHDDHNGNTNCACMNGNIEITPTNALTRQIVDDAVALFLASDHSSGGTVQQKLNSMITSKQAVGSSTISTISYNKLP